MTQHRPREIQLTSKQLVFVFMSTVLVAVVVFLLGVWVGRGIDTGSLAATGDLVDGARLTSEPPSPPAGSGGASPGSADAQPLTYPTLLDGSRGTTAASGGPPAPSTADPPQAPNPASTSAATPPATSAPPPPAPRSEPRDPPAGKPAAPDDESWVIQVGAYSAKARADKVASDFKAKGFQVSVTPGPSFRVWLGPYPKRAAADQVAVRLRKEGQDLRVIKPR
jgi:cell division septation protein DedD